MTNVPLVLRLPALSYVESENKHKAAPSWTPLLSHPILKACQNPIIYMCPLDQMSAHLLEPLNQKSWRSICHMYRALVIKQKRYLNQMVSILVWAVRNLRCTGLRPFRFIDLKESSLESLDFCSLTPLASDKLTLDSLETGTFCNIRSRLPCISLSGDVTRVPWLLSSWHSVRCVRHLRCSSFECISNSVRVIGLTTPASTFGVAKRGCQVGYKICCWSLYMGWCSFSILFVWRLWASSLAWSVTGILHFDMWTLHSFVYQTRWGLQYSSSGKS